MKVANQKLYWALMLCAAAITFEACGNKKKAGQEETAQTTKDSVSTPAQQAPAAAPAAFDINSVPVTDKNVGAFPFFTAPTKYAYRNATTKDFDREYFTVKGKLLPMEGKTYKAEIVDKDNKGSSAFSALEVEKSYEQAILALGGVKVNDEKAPRAERERVGDDEIYKKGYGYVVGMSDEVINTYVIRTKDAEIWISMQCNSAYGQICILQKGKLTATVDIIKADELKKEIDANGKAVLHINFATDKSDITPEGQQAVDEIVKLMQNDAALKLSVNGYTDNTGDKAKNQQLSSDRAKAVAAAIQKGGIAANRLQSKGFGADKPIADNTTEEGKAQNRRVELVKI